MDITLIKMAYVVKRNNLPQIIYFTDLQVPATSRYIDSNKVHLNYETLETEHLYQADKH
jgi:hypothetical protein